MKKIILFFTLSAILSIEGYSQIFFENGYFINNSNQRIECLIKNIDWKNNPTEFEYRISQDSIIQKVTIETVKEFGIKDVFKYIRATVKIDRSSDNIDNMSSERIPLFLEEQLFLKVLVEGKASLFIYDNGNLTRFFFNVNDSLINQLVYKPYLKENNITYNNYFRKQLFIALNCQTSNFNDVKNIQYNKRDLEQFFKKYNECTNTNYFIYESKQKKDLFNLSIRPGLNSSNLAIRNSTGDTWVFNYGNKFAFRVGIETEFVLPFNKNKWSIIIEPTYQYYKTEKTKETNNVSGGILVSKVKYQSLELPVGLRHYFYFNNDSKIFINLSYIFDFSTNSSIKFSRVDGSILNSVDINSRRNLALGLGYKYLNKYSLEIRYQTNREILGDYLMWKSKYETLSIIFGLLLF